MLLPRNVHQGNVRYISTQLNGSQEIVAKFSMSTKRTFCTMQPRHGRGRRQTVLSDFHTGVCKTLSAWFWSDLTGLSCGHFSSADIRVKEPGERSCVRGCLCENRSDQGTRVAME